MAEGQGRGMVQADLEGYRQVQIKEMEITETKKSPLCEMCVKERPLLLRGLPKLKRWFIEPVAVFLCSTCEMYVCVNCLPGHASHEGMRVGRNESEREEREISESKNMEEESLSERIKNKGKGLGKKTKRMRLEEGNEKEEGKKESDRMEDENEREQRERERMEEESGRMEEESERKLSLLLDDLMIESETERKEKFDRSHVSIYDRVYVKHELDQQDCRITGLCVLENQGWVACDYHNGCIKIFTLGSNVLQRYIRFVGSDSKPLDVTEILVDHNSTEPNLVYHRRSVVSVTDWAEQNKQCLIAVTLPEKRQIMVLDLSKKPSFIHKVIGTKGKCYSIQFYDDKIFTACREDLFSPWAVYIYCTDGDALKNFDTGIYGYFPGLYLAIVSRRVYSTIRKENKVQCRNVEGQVLHEITLEGSEPTGIIVDSDNNVYVCAGRDDKVYKLDADLTRYKSVLDQTADYIKEPEALCYYRDKLFISHGLMSSLRNFVTVVRLL